MVSPVLNLENFIWSFSLSKYKNLAINSREHGHSAWMCGLAWFLHCWHRLISFVFQHVKDQWGMHHNIFMQYILSFTLLIWMYAIHLFIKLAKCGSFTLVLVHIWNNTHRRTWGLSLLLHHDSTSGWDIILAIWLTNQFIIGFVCNFVLVFNWQYSCLSTGNRWLTEGPYCGMDILWIIPLC
jgi:hypothetical protein